MARRPAKSEAAIASEKAAKREATTQKIVTGLAKLQVLSKKGEIQLSYLEVVKRHPLTQPTVFNAARDRQLANFQAAGYIEESTYHASLPTLGWQHGSYLERMGVKLGFLATDIKTDAGSNHDGFVTLDDELFIDPTPSSNENIYAILSSQAAHPLQASTAPEHEIIARQLKALL